MSSGVCMMSYLLSANKAILWGFFIAYAFVLPALFYVEIQTNDGFVDNLSCEVGHYGKIEQDCLFDIGKIRKYSNWISLSVPLVWLVPIINDFKKTRQQSRQ